MAPHSQPWITRIDPNCGPQGVVPGCSFGNPDRGWNWPIPHLEAKMESIRRLCEKRPLTGLRSGLSRVDP
jgi:hypothetical protein